MFGNKIRGYTRLLLVAIVSSIAFLMVMIVGLFPVKKEKKYKLGLRIRKVWSKICLWILNYQVEIRGEFPTDRNYLFVGNHRSSLDPFVFLAHGMGNPVSRGDVRKYPIVGKGAEVTGIIFVDKESKSSRGATKEAIYQALKNGKSIMIYPEGKTGAQPLTATFQKGSYEQAAELHVPVVPFAIEYKNTNDYWDHTDGMLLHYLKNLAKPKTKIRLSVGQPIEGDNSWTLLRQSQLWINEEIERMRSDWGGLVKEKS
ncbi:MAG TPA: lysophospholipid acyltransferase family protein [Saprospiraceae bacterium]|nr:lysophospholipid acyltransferase family protein [Saprospiraceae bacterium]